MKAVNLIPDEQRGDAGLGGGRSGGGAYAVLGLLAGLTILLLLYAIARHDVSNRKAELASISAREQQANASAGQLSAYTSFIGTREQRTQVVTQLAESRFAWAHALYELGRVLPLGVSITSLSGQVASASSSTGASAAPARAGTVASATPPGTVPSFLLSGCATSQRMVATMLNRLSLIHGVSEATLQASSSQGGSAGAAAAGGGSGNCAKSAPSFTVQVTYEPLPGGAASAASSSGGPSGPSNSTLERAQSAGGAG